MKRVTELDAPVIDCDKDLLLGRQVIEVYHFLKLNLLKMK